MNRPLKTSLLGNLLLLLLVLWLVYRMHGAADRPAVPATTPIANVMAESTAVHAETVKPAPRPDPKPFRWSQLESSNDYRAYVANLRAIGCPETIIRSIVQLDVSGAFAFKRGQLHLAASGTGPWSLRGEMELVARLLGEPSAGPELAAMPPATQNPRPWQTRPTAPSLPLVLQPVDENAMPLTDSQKQVIVELRQQFINAIGGTNQDPNDPAYLARWQAAQPKIDDTLRGLLGIKFYVSYRQQAANAGFSQ